MSRLNMHMRGYQTINQYLYLYLYMCFNYRISLYLGACAYMRKHAYFSDFRKSSLARLLAHAPIFEYRRTSHIPSEMALEISNRYDYLNNSVVAVLQSVNTWIFVQN